MGSGESGTWSRQPDGSGGESPGPSLSNKAAIPLKADRELCWPCLWNQQAPVMSKRRAGLQEQCSVLCGILLSHAGTTKPLSPPSHEGTAGCRGSSPCFHTGCQELLCHLCLDVVGRWNRYCCRSLLVPTPMRCCSWMGLTLFCCQCYVWMSLLLPQALLVRSSADRLELGLFADHGHM